MADARARICWLHVSDLHVAKESLGPRPARRPGSELWAEVLRELFADLDRQLELTGLRPDLVLATGDLAYSGAAKQYDDLDAQLLVPLLTHLRARGCDAVLVAVPGNHDVQRPAGAAKYAYRLLREYDTHDDQDDDLRDLRAQLWQQRDAAFLSPLFAGYMAWSERSMLPGLAERTLPSGLRIEGLHRSHVPGDLSVVAARDGLRLLLVGLNSAWIQFDGGDFKGKLHVPIEQLYAALAVDEHAALPRFDDAQAALLLMHHPRDWLSPAATRTFDGYVYPARDERFSAFMFGHMHEARAETSSGSGGAMRHFYQSPSLFGLEHYGESQARLDVGYTLGSLREDGEIRLWVRRLGKHGRFDVDAELRRQADGALLLRAGRAPAPRVAVPHPDHATAPDVRPSDRAQLGAWLLSRHEKLELLAPAATFSYPFDEVYIPLELAMQQAWRGRASEGDLEHGQGHDITLPEIFARARDDREVMIFGHPGAGKTTTLEKICHQMLIEGGEAVGLPRATLPLLLPLLHLTREDLEQDDPLLPLARREVVRGDAPLGAEVLERLWAQGGLLLLLDGLDEVADMELRDDIVRHVVRSASWRRRRGVRIIVSSRFSGVTQALQEVLDGQFLRLDVRPLQRDRIAALVHSWFRAAKCWQVAPRTSEERARVEAEARVDAERVLDELRRIEHEDFEFKSLVATPLLLTLLCAVALANGQIPQRRPEFYQRCLEVLLRRYTQKTGRSAPLQERETLRVLQEVAFGLHEARRRVGLSAEALAGWVSRRADRSGRARMSPGEAAELLAWLHQQAGVLTKRGHDDYGFSHLTFQEYLSALHVAYGGEGPIEALADRFGDPWWQEVTLLCLALPLRRTFEVFMTRVLDGDRWLADAPGDDEASPAVLREPRLPLQLLRECWEAAEERSVEPLLRVLERPRAVAGWRGWLRGLLGRPEDAERIDRQRVGVLQLLLGETDPELVVLARSLSTDPREGEAVRAIATELVARARRGTAEQQRLARGLSEQLRSSGAMPIVPATEAMMPAPVVVDSPLASSLPLPAEEASAPKPTAKSIVAGAAAGAGPMPAAKPAATAKPATAPAPVTAKEPTPTPALAEEPAFAEEPEPACAEEDEASARDEDMPFGRAPSEDVAFGREPSREPSEVLVSLDDAGLSALEDDVVVVVVETERSLARSPQRREAPLRSIERPAEPTPRPSPAPPPSVQPAPRAKRRLGRLEPEAPEAAAPAPGSTAAPAAPAPTRAAPLPATRDDALVPSSRPWGGSATVASSAAGIDLDRDDVCIEPITKIRLLWVPGGQLMMGSGDDDPEANDDEKPRHLVRLQGFWLAETPVTNAQYAEYVKAHADAHEPRYWRDRELAGRDQPVVGVSWHEARAFCEWLGHRSGWSIALPSEAQWEYAARGAEGWRYPWGNEPPDDTRGCFGLPTSNGRPAPVGQYPRGRGPFEHLDLAGNVWEWCRDAGDPAAYARAATWARIDPVRDDPGAVLRVGRGGGWYDPASALRAARRTLCAAASSSVGQGFRVCRALDGAREP